MEKFVLFLTLTLIQVSRQDELPVLEEPKESLPSTPSLEPISDRVKFSSEESNTNVNRLEEISKLFEIQFGTRHGDGWLEKLIHSYLVGLGLWSNDYDDDDDDNDDDWWPESDEWLDSNESDDSEMESNEDLMEGRDEYVWRQSAQVKVPNQLHGSPFKRFTSV